MKGSGKGRVEESGERVREEGKGREGKLRNF